MGQKAHSLKGHFDVVQFLIERAPALGKEGEDEPGEQSDEERDELEGGETEGGGVRVCDIGERPRWKVIGDHKRQRANDAISGRGRWGVDQHGSVGRGERANISEGVRTSKRTRARRNGRGSQTEIG